MRKKEAKLLAGYSIDYITKTQTCNHLYYKYCLQPQECYKLCNLIEKRSPKPRSRLNLHDKPVSIKAAEVILISTSVLITLTLLLLIILIMSKVFNG